MGKQRQEYFRIRHLPEHLRNLKGLIDNGLDGSIQDYIKQSDIDYFQKNVTGLQTVLNALKGERNGTP